jgi:hypothetical protein
MMPNHMNGVTIPQGRRRIAPVDPACPVCRRTYRHRLQDFFTETVQQFARCRRCGDFYRHHRVQHPHLLVERTGEVWCDRWSEDEEDAHD